MMVEAAEREVSGYIRRQPFRPRRSGAGPIAKKTPLQTDQFLGVKPVGDTGRVAGGVRDSILNGGKTRRARIAQIGRLHWRRPQREHSQPVAVRVSVQVDQDIATVGANQRAASLSSICAIVLQWPAARCSRRVTASAKGAL